MSACGRDDGLHRHADSTARCPASDTILHRLHHSLTCDVGRRARWLRVPASERPSNAMCDLKRSTRARTGVRGRAAATSCRGRSDREIPAAQRAGPPRSCVRDDVSEEHRCCKQAAACAAGCAPACASALPLRCALVSTGRERAREARARRSKCRLPAAAPARSHSCGRCVVPEGSKSGVPMHGLHQSLEVALVSFSTAVPKWYCWKGDARAQGPSRPVLPPTTAPPWGPSGRARAGPLLPGSSGGALQPHPRGLSRPLARALHAKSYRVLSLAL